MIRNRIILILVIFFSLVVNANDQCFEMVPEIESKFNGLRAIPGGISDQIQIDKDANGFSRFTFQDDVVLIDAERVPVFGGKRKQISPVVSIKGAYFEGIHIAGKTNKSYHNGIEVFDMKLVAPLSSDSLEYGVLVDMFEEFTKPYYFKNFVMQMTPFERDFLEGPVWILRHQEDREEKWSHHSFLYNSGVILPELPVLNLFFETDFDNSVGESDYFVLNWLDNSTSGPRIDTCVYFLVRSQ